MKYEFALCAGRHDTPASQAIFQEITDPTNFDGMLDYVAEAIPADTTELVVYVTGLTPAMLAVVVYCECCSISLTAMHFDRETGSYLPQEIFSYKECPRCHRRHHAYEELCPRCWGNS